MYHVAMEVRVILWGIITQSLKKREKDSRAKFFILNNKNNNKNAKIKMQKYIIKMRKQAF